MYGTSAITALTAQNTLGVDATLSVPPEIVAAQIESTVADIRPDAVKTGMLPDRATVEVVVDAARRHGWPILVVDPVWVATSGYTLSEDEALAASRDDLLPLATIVTPNLREAGALTGSTVSDRAAAERAARTLVEDRSVPAVLVTGGDLAGDVIVDTYYDGDRLETFVEPRIVARGVHGSGCALASAIAARLARGETLFEAVEGARNWVREAIRRAPDLGAGNGPLDLTTPHDAAPGGEPA